VFHNSILAGVKRNHSRPTAKPERTWNGEEEPLEMGPFTVDRDSERLKDLGGWMRFPPPSWTSNIPPNEFFELRRRFKWRLFPMLDYYPSDSLGLRFLS
jgi:hypothetical protein